MKTLLFMALTGLSVAACSNDKTTTETTTVTTTADSTGTGGAVATTYTCPMHPEVTSNQPGQCPKCHMDLVKQ